MNVGRRGKGEWGMRMKGKENRPTETLESKKDRGTMSAESAWVEKKESSFSLNHNEK